MNLFQKAVLHVAAWIAPKFRKAIDLAGGVEEFADDMRDYSAIRGSRMASAASLASELREAAHMGPGGPSMGSRLSETITAADLALEDRTWLRQTRLSEMEFSRWGLQTIILICRRYRIVDPLIKRAVTISADYVFARGVEIRSENEAANTEIQKFLNDPGNQREFGHIGLIEKDRSLTTDGNLFFVLFTDVYPMQIRTIDPLQIQDIVTNPEDAAEVWYYRRQYSQRTFEANSGVVGSETKTEWYADIGYDSPDKTIGGFQVMPDRKVIRIQTGGLASWLFHVPDIWSAVTWSRTYKEFLDDWATRSRSLSTIAWDAETKGGATAIQNMDQALSTKISTSSIIDRNPKPVTGAVFTHGPGTKLSAQNVRNASQNPEEGRRIGLQVASATGLPETMLFGDASTGSLATAQSLDRPTELKFLQRQELWRYVFLTVLRFVVSKAARQAGGGFRESLVTRGLDPSKPLLFLMPTYQRIRGSITEIWALSEAQRKQPDVVPITVRFPAILEHSILDTINAIVNALTLNTKSGTVYGIDEKVGVAMLLHELGYEDVDGLIEKMYPEASYKPLREKPDPVTPPTAMPPGVPPVPPAPVDKQTKEAIDLLREAIQAINADRLAKGV